MRASSTCRSAPHGTARASRRRSWNPRSPRRWESYQSTEGAGNRRITYDAATGTWAINVGLGFGSVTLPDSLAYAEKGSDTFSIVEGDPLSARADSEWTITLGRGDWQTRVETRSAVSCDPRSFHVTNSVDGFEGDDRIFSRSWTEEIPRDAT